MTTITDTAWHAWRRGDDLPDNQTAVTASIIARCATGKYGGMYAAVAERLDLLTNDIDPYLAQRGHDWENTIGDMVHLATGHHIVGAQTLCQHPQQPWIRATIDAFISPIDPAGPDDLTGVTEYKTRSSAAYVAPWDYWNAQIQWQMLATQLTEAVLAVAYIDDITGRLTGLKIHDIQADYAHQIELQAIADTYRWHVHNQQLPVREDADLDHVKTVTHHTPPGVLEIGDEDELSVWLTIYDEAKHLAKHSTTRKTQAETMIRQLLDNRQADTVHTQSGWKAKLSKPRMIVTNEAKAALMQAYPELGAIQFVGSTIARKLRKEEYEAAATPVGTRTLTITPPKEPTQ